MQDIKQLTYLGELAKDITPDEVEVYETDSIIEGYKKYPELPRVAYVYMLQTQGLLHDTYVYGVDAKKTISTYNISNRSNGWSDSKW